MNIRASIIVALFLVGTARGAEIANSAAMVPEASSGAPAALRGALAVAPSDVGTTLSQSVGQRMCAIAASLPQSIGQWFCAAALAGIIAGVVIFLLYRSRKSNAKDAADLSSAQLGVIAVAVGAAFGFGGAMLSSHDPVLDLIVAAVASVLVIQLAETLRSHQLTRRMQSLERALDSETTYAWLDEQLNDLAEFSGLLRKHPGARSLFDEFLAESYGALADSLESLSTGTINVNDTARELTFNKDCLLHLAHKEVWAVSYQDGSFWDDPEGKDFLLLHDEKIKADVVIHRIFVLTEEELAAQKPTIVAQMARKIQCRILLLDSESGRDFEPEDFVVYDETFVRAANLVKEGPTTTLKRAVLSCDPRKVRAYLQKRNDFKTRSEPAADVFARPMPPPPSNPVVLPIASPPPPSQEGIAPPKAS